MLSIERASFIEQFIETHCRGVMASKGIEYSRNEEDCNSNFKRVAGATGMDPISVAWVYALKHIDSISNYVKTRETPSGEPIEGRLGDAVNYLLILASLIEEDRRQYEWQAQDVHPEAPCKSQGYEVGSGVGGC